MSKSFPVVRVPTIHPTPLASETAYFGGATEPLPTSDRSVSGSKATTTSFFASRDIAHNSSTNGNGTCTASGDKNEESAYPVTVRLINSMDDERSDAIVGMDGNFCPFVYIENEKEGILGMFCRHTRLGSAALMVPTSSSALAPPSLWSRSMLSL
ncbi:hypothetical protein KCV00_g295, partial [Aureobasidium melanogenum]